jgi:hypothetical protein
MAGEPARIAVAFGDEEVGDGGDGHRRLDPFGVAGSP